MAPCTAYEARVRVRVCALETHPFAPRIEPRAYRRDHIALCDPRKPPRNLDESLPLRRARLVKRLALYTPRPVG
jgi:hypothetical protein